MAKLGALAEPEAFRLRIGQCLADGDFVFLYVVRDLDPRTERVIDYLTSRPRIPLFVVEVDNYLAGRASVLVPRAVGVPPWVTTAATADTTVSDSHADALMLLMDQLAEQLHVEVRHAATGKRYYSHLGDAYIGVYR